MAPSTQVFGNNYIFLNLVSHSFASFIRESILSTHYALSTIGGVSTQVQTTQKYVSSYSLMGKDQRLNRQL